MSQLPVIGIDLGTTNSVVSYTDDAGTTHVIADENGDRIVPSVIHFTTDGDIVVGHQAREYASIQPERVARVFKRGMGEPTHLADGQPFKVDGKTYAPEELSSIVLKKLSQVAEQHLGGAAKRAVITVPHYFGDPERAATRSAGEIAGLEVLQIVNEPTAAAIAHGIDARGEESGKLLVFDLGGGTFDVTVMRYGAGGDMTVIAGDGDRELGGADFDRAILQDMTAAVKAQTGGDLGADLSDLADAIEAAESIKKELSTRQTSMKRLISGGQSVTYELTRERFASLIAQQIEYVEDAVGRVFDDEAVGGNVDKALMVGGSSRIPLFKDLVREITGLEPLLTKNLDEDVSRGASMLGAKLGSTTLDPRSELAKMPKPTDAASHAVGITLVREDGHTEYNQVIIPRGASVPYSGTFTFGAASDNQSEVVVVLNEGDDEDLTFTRELTKSLGRFSRPVPRGYALRFEVEYTVEQLVKVSVFDGETGERICEVEIQRDGVLNETAKAEARAFLTRTPVS
jgi:molecular chaperone DnaK